MFLELSEMGSAILAYSAIEQIKRDYPQARLYFWIFEKNRDSVDILNIIPRENIITMRDQNIFLLFVDAIKNIARIRKERIEVVFDMELFSRYSAILSFLSGAKTRIGFSKFTLESLYRGNLHTHKVSYNPYMHISKNFLSLARSLKAAPGEMPLLKMPLSEARTIVPKILSGQKQAQNIWSKLKNINPQINEKNKVVILNPGLNEILPLRKWPMENYEALAKELLLDPLVFIVISGIGPDSSKPGPFFDGPSGLRIINLVGKTTVREMIDLYNVSSLLISHDSGTTNLASLTNINIIVLFGPETPLLYAPLSENMTVLYSNLACSPCLSAYNHRRSACRDNACLKGISVGEVCNAAKVCLLSRE